MVQHCTDTVVVPDVLDRDAVGREEALDLAPPRLGVVEHPAPGFPEGCLGAGEVVDEVLVGVVEEQVVVDELLPGNDARCGAGRWRG